MQKRLHKILIATAISLVIAGCSSGPRIDASSPEHLLSSLDKYAKHGGGDAKARQQAVTVLKSAYLSGKEFRTKLAKGTPPLEILMRAKFEDVQTIAARVERWQKEGMKVKADPEIPESATERRWRNTFIIEQLSDQIALLESARDIARYQDLFTIDQFQYSDSAFIPPQDGVPLGKDVATFTTTFHNTAVFNVYSVGFHVVVKDPTLIMPLVDEVLVYEPKDDPIQVGESRQIQMTCCDSFRNQTTNLALRQLPENASIDMELVTVADYSKGDRLKDVKFTAADNLKLMASKVCQADIQSRLDTWTPETADQACRNY